MDKLLQQRRYKRNIKEIIERLDEKDHYAPIHYAVQANNKFVLKELLERHKCGKDKLLSVLFYDWFCFFLYFSRYQSIRL